MEGREKDKAVATRAKAKADRVHADEGRRVAASERPTEHASEWGGTRIQRYDVAVNYPLLTTPPSTPQTHSSTSLPYAPYRLPCVKPVCGRSIIAVAEAIGPQTTCTAFSLLRLVHI